MQRTLPRKNVQLVVDGKTGDCFRACVTSLLGLPNDDRFPNIHDGSWFASWEKFLQPFGLLLEYDKERIWRDGFWIASVPSLNFEGVSHAVVMDFDQVAHDPSTKLRYQSGSALASTNVHGGYYLVVADASKLYLLDEYRTNIPEKPRAHSITPEGGCNLGCC